MKEDKQDINVLDELNKGACMGRDAIHFIMDKVKDENLKKELERQYAKYKETNEKYVSYIQSIMIENLTKQERLIKS